MNIIKTYLDNMFAGLPNTKEVRKMKEDLLLNMEEKYLELKSEGKTENEAVGKVISEFGNIEELAYELGVDITPVVDVRPVVTKELATEYMAASKKFGLIIAFGVFLCILSPILLILLSETNYIKINVTDEIRVLIGLVILFIIVAIAIVLFVYSGLNLSKYDKLQKDIIVPANVKFFIEEEKKKFDPTFNISLIISIIMYIFSPLTLIILSLTENGENTILYGVAVLLFIVSIATFIIVKAGMVRNSHNVMLELEDYAKDKKTSEKRINVIAGIYWPVVSAGYLLWSFIANTWEISWIVWVIAGVLFGAIASFINAIEDSKDKK